MLIEFSQLLYLIYRYYILIFPVCDFFEFRSNNSINEFEILLTISIRGNNISLTDKYLEESIYIS